jgi:signal transduction histidine kinase
VIAALFRKSSGANPRLASRLRSALLLTLLAVLVLATVAAAITAFIESSDVQDETLLSVAHLVRTNQINARFDATVFRDDDLDDGVHVWELGSKKHRRLPISPSLSDGFHTVNGRGGLWRVYVTDNRQSGKRYAVVQKLSVKTELARKSAFNTALPLLGLFLLVPLLITFIVRHSFRPLDRLGRRISGSESLKIDLSNREEIPVEVLPFVSSIEVLLEKNDAYNARQRRFIADAAHELRTPITALSLEIDNLRTAPDQTQRDDREAILKSSAERLQRLVNQLLDLARAQSINESQQQVVCLNDILKMQVADLYVLAENKHIELLVDRNETVHVADIGNQLQHLVRNALSNAIKFTHEHGQVTIEIYPHDGRAHFHVRDNGPGVTEEHLKKLHEPFYRPVEQATLTGAGLGLAICHEIATGLNGQLALRNLPGGGFGFHYMQPTVDAMPVP